MVIADTQDGLNAAAQALRDWATEAGQNLELLAVHGLGGAQAHLHQYINLVVLNYVGLPAARAIPTLAGLRDAYCGPAIVVSDDATVDSCTWGRRYSADYHADALAALGGYVAKVLERDRPQGKTALVFAGGGILGGFNEAGSLKALYDFGIREADMYIGLSAGSWVAAMAANDVTPELMIEHPHLHPRDFYQLNGRDILRQLTMLGPNVVRSLAQRVLHPDSDWLFQLSSIFTTSPLTGDRLRQRFCEVLGQEGGTNDFGELRERGRELYIMAVELDSAERRVFGEGDDIHVPISEAVSASSALPMFYRPVHIDGRDYVDGGLARSACIDTAIDNGADLIVCLNPLVPYTGGDPGHIKALGLAGIAEQSVRALIHSRLHATVERFRQIHPHVTILLIEPDTNDPAMFHNPLRGSENMIQLAALEGFKSTKAFLEERSEFIQHIFASHGRTLAVPAADDAGAGDVPFDHMPETWVDDPDVQELA